MSVMEGSYPTGEAEILTPDAMRAADAEILAQLAAAPARKPRGRPPGSRNKPKTDDDGNFVPPRSARAKTEPITQDEAKRKIEAKKRLAKDYEQKILESNDKLLGFLIQNGIPAGLFYKNGVAPSQGPRTNTNWTELANQVAIPAHLANLAGLTAAELQSSTIGTSITDTLEGDSPVRLLILIGATLAVGVPYLRNLNEIRKRVVAMQEAADQYNTEQARAGAMPMQVQG